MLAKLGILALPILALCIVAGTIWGARSPSSARKQSPEENPRSR